MSFAEATKTIVPLLMQAEYNNACKKFGYFGRSGRSKN
jgi:hypothetical protein